LRLTSTGSLTLAPITGNTFNLASLTFNGSIASNTFTGLDDANGLVINNFSNLGGLVLGSYLGSGVGGDTPYSFNNTSATDIQSNVAIAGYMSIFGADILFNSNLTTTASGSKILAKATRNITVQNSRTLQTNNADVILWSDSDGNNDGYISLDNNNNVINTANGSTTATTGGGRIVLAGGINSDINGVPTGFATTNGQSGVSFTQNNTLFSGGGDIIIRGKGTDTNGHAGIYTLDGLRISSGVGAITLTGEAAGYYGIVFSASGGSNATLITSAKTSGTAISITGSTTKANLHGVVFDFATIEEVLATGGGTIAINGTGGSAGYGVWLQNTRILASSGAVAINGNTGGINANATNTLGRFSSGITSSSSDITLTGNVLNIMPSSSMAIATSGKLTLQPFANSFSSAITWPITNVNLSNDVSGLTIGKPTNTANITFGSATTIAGPITAFGGEIIIGSGANLTTTTANNINLIASNGFTTAGTTRTTINSNGGNILIAADADANNTGQLNLDYLTLDAGTGNLTIEGSTMSWDVATNTYPILKGTGALTIQSNGASFGQVVDLQWFALEGVKSSFTFGKTSNVTALTTNNCTSCASSSDNFTGKTLSVTGPIAVFGSTLAINSALTATNSNITLGATTAITQTAAITANGLALIGAGAATLTNAGNSINTIAGGTSSVRIGALNFNNNKALTVGTVGTAGIFSTGAIELATSSGDVILTEPVNSTLASGDAVKLFADKDALAGAVGDGNIKFSGNGAVTIASGARALFYSGTETASTGLTTAIGGIANYRYNVANNTVLGSIVPAIATTGRFGLLRTTANADLSALAVSVGTLSPTFAAATITYTASVSNATTSMTVTPTRSDANATITVNGTAVISGNTSGAINLTVGANTITTVVTAQNGTTTNTYTITVTRRQTQTITFSALSVATFNDADIVPGATSSSGLTVNYASSNTAVATIVSGNIRIVGAGSAVITASQIGNASFDAATDVQRTLTVNKGTATLTLSNLTPTYDGTAKSATITTSPAGLSGVAITYAGSATAPTAAGTYAVIASLTNDNYTATNATGSLVIGKAIQTITFPALASKTTSDVDYEPGATVNSGLALRYTSSNTAVATVYQDAADGNKWKISIQGSGTTDITAIQDGNSDYNSASFLRALPVGTSLPVTVVSYDAKLNTNGTVQLTWLTASETNNSYFELQRSTDGITFTTIGKVTGAGNSTQEKRYDFIDLSPLAGTNYYKLLQYDKDGKKTDLGVRSVKVLLKENELTVYPNPSNGIVNVSFDINSYQKVELVDLTGKILMTKTIGRQASTISFDISDLSAGVYNIRLTGERKLAIKQIVKH
jgi:hypothetical protein